MKKVLLSLTIALLIPGMLSAQTLGLFFDYQPPGKMSTYPSAFVAFEMYLYMHHADYYVTAIEYQLQTPLDPGHSLFFVSTVTYPDNESIVNGDPFAGHSIAYWPPMNGFMPGYNLMCTIEGVLTAECWNAGGGVVDYPLVIGPHPDSGELRGTYTPDNYFFDIIGLTSILCPDAVGVEEESWGAIKSMFE